MKEISDNDLLNMAKTVIDTEARGISALNDQLDDHFIEACRLILSCKGRVIVTGMGKSGHIAGKLAATFASTGTPSFFVHPGEASHGDLGMIVQNDVVIALSNSGETDELLLILPIIKRLGIPLISLTGNPNSTLGKNSTAHLDVSVKEEACPLGLAPTASTTASLVMGDALAVTLLEARGFTADDFARSHPAGALGRKLLLQISDIMHSDEQIPQVSISASLPKAILEMTQKGLGMTAITDKDGCLAGIITDGDLRRTLESGIDVRTIKAKDLMNTTTKTIRADQLAVEAAQMMDQYKINALPVVDDNNKIIGALNIHDLFRARVI